MKILQQCLWLTVILNKMYHYNIQNGRGRTTHGYGSHQPQTGPHTQQNMKCDPLLCDTPATDGTTYRQTTRQENLPFLLDTLAHRRDHIPANNTTGKPRISIGHTSAQTRTYTHKCNTTLRTARHRRIH
jgi:hypothetical protein